MEKDELWKFGEFKGRGGGTYLLSIWLIFFDVFDDLRQVLEQVRLLVVAKIMSPVVGDLHDQIDVCLLSGKEHRMDEWSGRYMTGGEPVAVDVDARLSHSVPKQVK